MAAMGSSDRIAVGARFQTDVSNALESFGAFTKADVQAAVSAFDDWIVANASSANTALPLAFRSGATTAQKARLFVAVFKRRYETGA